MDERVIETLERIAHALEILAGYRAHDQEASYRATKENAAGDTAAEYFFSLHGCPFCVRKAQEEAENGSKDHD